VSALFDLSPQQLPPAPCAPDGSPAVGRDQTRYQLKLLGIGVHPITLQPLHPDATAARTKDERDAPGLRCDTCRFLRTSGGGYLKCHADQDRYDTRTPATDVRRWWPACALYQAPKRQTGGS
jgi:hypothetical protein